MSDRELSGAARYLNGYPDGINHFLLMLSSEARLELVARATTLEQLVELLPHLNLSKASYNRLERAVLELKVRLRTRLHWPPAKGRLAEELTTPELLQAISLRRQRGMVPKQDVPSQSDCFLMLRELNSRKNPLDANDADPLLVGWDYWQTYRGIL